MPVLRSEDFGLKQLENLHVATKEIHMKAKAVHKLSEEELAIEVDNLRKKLFELKTQSVTEKIQDTSQYGKIRKDIARLLTEQTIRRVVTAEKG